MFTGMTGYRDIQWSKHNNAIQACESLYSISKFSRFCNETIEAGLSSGHMFKQWYSEHGIPVHTAFKDRSPFTFTAVIVVTLFAMVGGLILTRPRMQPFSLVTSIVRLEPQWISGVPGDGPDEPEIKISSSNIRSVEGQVVMTTKNSSPMGDINQQAYHGADPYPFIDISYRGPLEPEDDVLSQSSATSMSSDDGDEPLPKVRFVTIYGQDTDRRVQSPQTDIGLALNDSDIDGPQDGQVTLPPTGRKLPAPVQYYIARLAKVKVLCDEVLILKKDLHVKPESRSTPNLAEAATELKKAVGMAKVANRLCLAENVDPEVYEKEIIYGVNRPDVVAESTRGSVLDFLRGYWDALELLEVLRSELKQLEADYDREAAELDCLLYEGPRTAVEIELLQRMSQNKIERQRLSEEVALAEAKVQELRESFIPNEIAPDVAPRMPSEYSGDEPPVREWVDPSSKHTDMDQRRPRRSSASALLKEEYNDNHIKKRRHVSLIQPYYPRPTGG